MDFTYKGKKNPTEKDCSKEELDLIESIKKTFGSIGIDSMSIDIEKENDEEQIQI